jgi:hypothetical protein
LRQTLFSPLLSPLGLLQRRPQISRSDFGRRVMTNSQKVLRYALEIPCEDTQQQSLEMNRGRRSICCLSLVSEKDPVDTFNQCFPRPKAVEFCKRWMRQSCAHSKNRYNYDITLYGHKHVVEDDSSNN